MSRFFAVAITLVSTWLKEPIKVRCVLRTVVFGGDYLFLVDVNEFVMQSMKLHLKVNNLEPFASQ